MNLSIRKIQIVGFISLLVLGAIFFYQQGKFFDGKLHLVFCKVGQGDGIYIRTPKGVDIVIDGGPDNSILSCLSNHMPFWDRQIEIVVLTHPDSDHLDGLIPILNNYQVLNFYKEDIEGKSQSFKVLKDTLRVQKIKPRKIFRGDKLILKDKVVLEILSPKFSENSYSPNSNDFSIVQLLTYGQFKTLLTGDIDLNNFLFYQNFKEKIDILKIPHHGSKFNMNKAVLEAIKPNLAVITVGKNNYGHPAKSVLDMLKEAGIKTLRTDLDGEVEVVSDGKGWGIQ